MRIGRLWLPLIPLVATAQTPAPAINPDGVIRSDTRNPGTLAPGTLFSIYGRHLGPEKGCNAQPGTHPSELCGVRVLIGDSPAELSWVSDKQINARVPDTSPNTGAASLKVVFANVSSTPAEIRLGPLPVKISLEGAAHVAGPVWLHVDYPLGGGPRYPFDFLPWDFKCDRIEIRKDGKVLTPISPNPRIGEIVSGNPCGSIGLYGGPIPHTGSLPLHLQYRFDAPGIYEVRYSNNSFLGSDIHWQSDWTPVEVFPAAPRFIGAHPQDPAEILSDFLPGILARRDEETLTVVLEYLYHPSETVRRYAAGALYYWPDADVDARLRALVKAGGPTDVAVQHLEKTHVPELVVPTLPYLTSEDTVLMRGAITLLRAALSPDSLSLPQNIRIRAEQALVQAADRIISRSDPQTINEFIVTLGLTNGEASHQLLWSLVERRIGTGQAVIVIAWRKDPKDLPRLAALLQSALDPELFSLAYALRNAFDTTALPYLREAMENSTVSGLQATCAQELMNAKDPAGFAFAAQAIRQNRRSKGQLIGYLHDRFPQTRADDETALLDFLSLPLFK